MKSLRDIFVFFKFLLRSNKDFLRFLLALFSFFCIFAFDKMSKSETVEDGKPLSPMGDIPNLVKNLTYVFYT